MQEDDPTIRDPDPLWRRIHPTFLRSDGTVSSAAFSNSSDGSGMSVTLGREAMATGVTPKLALSRYPTHGLAAITAGDCRSHEQRIQRDPTAEDRHHALVSGEKTKAVQRQLARAAVMLALPERST